MELQYIPFEEIDKNKWNGLVHFATNNNPYAYHWYLKSIFKRFDVLVEGDYQSGMPILAQPKSNFQQKLIPSLGVYSVNAFTQHRLKAFYEKWQSLNGEKFFYPFNNYMNPFLEDLHKDFSKNERTVLDLAQDYPEIFNQYNVEVQQTLSTIKKDHIKVTSNQKPEVLLENSKLSKVEKNTLYRIMYNAIQRGIGFSSTVQNVSNQTSSSSFFLNSHNGIFEIFGEHSGQNDSMIILYDTIIKSNPNRMIKMYMLPEHNEIGKNLGFKTHDYYTNLGVKPTLLDNLKENVLRILNIT